MVLFMLNRTACEQKEKQTLPFLRRNLGNVGIHRAEMYIQLQLSFTLGGVSAIYTFPAVSG